MNRVDDAVALRYAEDCAEAAYHADPSDARLLAWIDATRAWAAAWGSLSGDEMLEYDGRAAR